MTDFLTPTQRSERMSRIHCRDTNPELKLRRGLHAMGFRYRLHQKNLIGRPDLVFPKYRTIVFVHGCFWHHHKDCPIASNPKTRTEFWQGKFSRNAERDKLVKKQLIKLGWKIHVVWECELSTKAKLNQTLAKVARKIKLAIT